VEDSPALSSSSMQITVHDKQFVPYIDANAIQKRIAELGAQISEDYKGQRPLIIAVLNGSFIFAADLFRHLTIEAEISFIKLASYKGTLSTGSVVTAIGLEEKLTGRPVMLLEDIIDTGKTLHSFLPEIRSRQPASLKIATFLTKPDALLYDVKANYIGFEIPDHFVVGYGLDYDGLGRNLPGLYTLIM
jgi:hypoxanthine phosphoribosyltransferase